MSPNPLSRFSARTLQKSVALLFALTTLVVITLTLIPLNGSGPKIPYFDKIVHFFMFGGWSFLFGWMFTITYHSYRRKHQLNSSSILSTDYTTPVYLIALSGFVFGGLIEILQGILPIGRTPDVADTLANGLGALVAAFFLKWISTKSFYRKSVELEE